MNEVYFSASTKGFYLGEYINDGTYENFLPDDLILMTEEENVIYRLGNPEFGKALGCAKGRPTWVDIPKNVMVSIYEYEKKERMLKVTNDINILQDAFDFEMATEEEKSMLNALKKHRLLLRRVDVSNAPKVIWPEMDVSF